MDEIFTKIQEDHEIQEHVQIKTCNRAEIYFVMDDSPNYHWDGLVLKRMKALEHVLKLFVD